MVGVESRENGVERRREPRTWARSSWSIQQSNYKKEHPAELLQLCWWCSIMHNEVGISKSKLELSHSPGSKNGSLIL